MLPPDDDVSRRLIGPLVDRLVLIRKAQALTRADVAARAQMDVANLHRFERKRGGPGLRALARVARALGYRLKVEIVPLDIEGP